MVQDLPVAVALPPPLDADVGAWVEHDLGWQLVEIGGVLRPAVVLADGPVDGVPWVAVTAGAPAAGEIRRHLTDGAADVVAWPQERDRLAGVVARVGGTSSGDPATTMTVVGAAGGVGTSTVALAIGGLLAWAGATVLVVGGSGLGDLAGHPREHDDVDDPRSADAAAVVPGVAATAEPVAGTSVRSVAGVPRLSVAVVPDGRRAVPWSGDVLVVDGGRATDVEPDTDLVVTRPDAGLRRARRLGCPVALVGDRPLEPRAVRRVLGRAPLVCLPWSERVARAGVRGRVPAALPGAWLGTLREGLGRLQGGAR